MKGLAPVGLPEQLEPQCAGRRLLVRIERSGFEVQAARVESEPQHEVLLPGEQTEWLEFALPLDAACFQSRFDQPIVPGRKED